MGLGVAAYRNLPSHIYAVSVGANFAISSGVFLGKVEYVTFRDLARMQNIRFYQGIRLIIMYRLCACKA